MFVPCSELLRSRPKMVRTWYGHGMAMVRTKSSGGPVPGTLINEAIQIAKFFHGCLFNRSGYAHPNLLKRKERRFFLNQIAKSIRDGFKKNAKEVLVDIDHPINFVSQSTFE